MKGFDDFTEAACIDECNRNPICGAAKYTSADKKCRILRKTKDDADFKIKPSNKFKCWIKGNLVVYVDSFLYKTW